MNYFFFFFQIYLSWANSVLSDCNLPQVVTVDTIRQGKVLCQLIETLWNATQDERLRHWDLVIVYFDFLFQWCHFGLLYYE